MSKCEEVVVCTSNLTLRASSFDDVVFSGYVITCWLRRSHSLGRPFPVLDGLATVSFQLSLSYPE